MTKNMRNLSIHNFCSKIFLIEATHEEIRGVTKEGSGFCSVGILDKNELKFRNVWLSNFTVNCFDNDDRILF